MQVTGVAQRLIAALGQGRGGGYQKHLRSFRWEVAVVNQPVMNGGFRPPVVLSWVCISMRHGSAITHAAAPGWPQGRACAAAAYGMRARGC